MINMIQSNLSIHFQVIFGTIAAQYGEFNKKYGMEVVGDIPSGYVQINSL